MQTTATNEVNGHGLADGDAGPAVEGDATALAPIASGLPPELAAALTAPVPRSGQARAVLVRAQRRGIGLVAAGLGASAIVFALAAAVGAWPLAPFAIWPVAIALAMHVRASMLARDGLAIAARVEPIGKGSVALRFALPDGGEARGQWRLADSTPAPETAVFLFDPKRGGGHAWTPGASGVVTADRLAGPPAARMLRGGARMLPAGAPPDDDATER